MRSCDRHLVMLNSVDLRSPLLTLNQGIVMAESYLIYLDVCCLNRPFDDWRQDRIRLEGQTILDIFKRFYLGKWKLDIACAEYARTDTLLTTDDRLLRKAIKYSHLLRVKLDNPVTWLMNTLLLQENEENDTN